MNPRGQKLKAAMQRVERAEEAMVKLLEKMFPVGTTVRFHVQYGQINPSIGTVVWHKGGRHAYIGIRLRSRTEQVRTVPARNVW